MSTIEFENVSKWFADTVALSDVTVHIDAGVTGLLGHNGAGKSTALQLLAGATRPSQGTVRVLGRDPHADPAVNSGLGVVADGEATWAHASARTQVEFLARQRGVRNHRAATADVLQRVGLTDAADRRVGGFSKGMRQRVKLAQALVHDPQVLLLDEPLNGLDPAQRRADVDLLAALGAEGRTVLVSSHVLSEVERMAARVLVVVNGRLVAEGEPAGIRELLVDRPRTVRLEGDRVLELAGALLSEGLVESVRREGAGRPGVLVEAPRAVALAEAVPRLARVSGARLRRVEGVGEDLESVFAHLVRAARGAGR
ncbi:ABC transporter ATP-binding protein [Kineococcus rhizosphaerae]|uniref:ABC-2 type transport system ATP-binding protein n=1 Tax=Kineococcus rhizosphaerae TaxID=559628 RepID=A0A2T0R1N4_9ACTN|nr:ABC transporter ATP-binding protein [Kineococcus rhizosphaerae]PRY13431.1 ABC-2 type transport system ATP-binding protein [Kineococcus rhizosphaerae]